MTFILSNVGFASALYFHRVDEQDGSMKYVMCADDGSNKPCVVYNVKGDEASPGIRINPPDEATTRAFDLFKSILTGIPKQGLKDSETIKDFQRKIDVINRNGIWGADTWKTLLDYIHRYTVYDMKKDLKIGDNHITVYRLNNILKEIKSDSTRSNLENQLEGYTTGDQFSDEIIKIAKNPSIANKEADDPNIVRQTVESGQQKDQERKKDSKTKDSGSVTEKKPFLTVPFVLAIIVILFLVLLLIFLYRTRIKTLMIIKEKFARIYSTIDNSLYTFGSEIKNINSRLSDINKSLVDAGLAKSALEKRLKQGNKSETEDADEQDSAERETSSEEGILRELMKPRALSKLIEFAGNIERFYGIGVKRDSMANYNFIDVNTDIANIKSAITELNSEVKEAITKLAEKNKSELTPSMLKDISNAVYDRLRDGQLPIRIADELRKFNFGSGGGAQELTIDYEKVKQALKDELQEQNLTSIGGKIRSLESVMEASKTYIVNNILPSVDKAKNSIINAQSGFFANIFSKEKKKDDSDIEILQSHLDLLYRQKLLDMATTDGNGENGLNVSRLWFFTEYWRSTTKSTDLSKSLKELQESLYLIEPQLNKLNNGFTFPTIERTSAKDMKRSYKKLKIKIEQFEDPFVLINNETLINRLHNLITTSIDRLQYRKIGTEELIEGLLRMVSLRPIAISVGITRFDENYHNQLTPDSETEALIREMKTQSGYQIGIILKVVKQGYINKRTGGVFIKAQVVTAI